MAKAMECEPLARLPRCGGTSWLQALIGSFLDRAAGQPTRLQPEELSRYLLRDMGLEPRAFGGPDRPPGRSPMDWPMR